MGRTKGKGKKQPVSEVGSDEEGKKSKVVPVVVQRKRGRPLKSSKEAGVQVVVVVESVVKKEENAAAADDDDLRNQSEKKRRVEENKLDSNGDIGVVAADDEPVRSVGFRQNGSRRKSKPRRSVVGVECN